MPNVNINAAEISEIQLADQVGNPANPAAGYKLIYAKSGGFYLINSAGTVVGPIKTLATDTLWDAAGDIVHGTGADTAGRLAIGTAGQYLNVNAGATAPAWVTGGQVLIAENSPTGTGTSTFSTITGVFSSLRVEFMGRSTKAGVTYEDMSIQYNGDTTAANYRSSTDYGFNATTGSDGGAASSAAVSAANSPANSCTTITYTILDYSKAIFNKQTIVNVAHRRDASSVYELAANGAIEWVNTAAITQIDLKFPSGNFVNGTKIRLYGVY